MDANLLWQKIKLSWQFITEKVRFRDHGDYLLTKNAFSYDDFDRIRTMHGKEQTHEMLLTMRRKSPESVFDFMASLRRECGHVAREIEDKVVVIAEIPDSNALAGDQTEMNYKQLVEELQEKLKMTEASQTSLQSQVKELQGELASVKPFDEATKRKESAALTKWTLLEGWQKDVVVEKVDSSMTGEMVDEVMSLTKEAMCKQSSVHTEGDLKSVAMTVAGTFNDLHGKYWQCLAGQADLFAGSVWPNADMFISLNVKLPSINKSLRVVLFKAKRNEWFYPVGWKDHLKLVIDQSLMSYSMVKDVKQLVLQAIRRRSAVHTVEDMNDIAEFIKATWEKTHAGCWQIVAGERGRYGGRVRYASGSYIALNVELTAVKETMWILLFKAEQDK